ncbi:AGE family epimerase/isomerase [Nocardioides insulae]|uniref:AGE family epimerase/isomerase n=1 Tax=Nocardioides insulae TaxID=394734 RepID=UPI000421FB94|nr:AGE family epimerase/isomerase [Nocardioides insulae]
MTRPGDRAYCAAQRRGLLRFAQGSRHPAGFGWLDDRGTVDPSVPAQLWITCRMTHVFSLGVLAGEEPAPGGPDHPALRDLAGHGVRALRTSFADPEYGGWFAAATSGGPAEPTKQAYGHAFVCLAAGSAVAARIPDADTLLEEALAVFEDRFWDEEAGLVVDAWDRSWREPDDYRGLNANMHAVEALLAVGDVLGEDLWHRRAARIAARVLGWARANHWRIPEHFDASWRPLLEHNRDLPGDRFRPYGATVGHGLEWARLLVAVEATLGGRAPAGLLEAAVALTDRAVSDGWRADGADGFIYTTDWDGSPVVRARMHWVLAEALNTALVLGRTTGDRRYDALAERWWSYADRHLVDRAHGSWWHELDPANRPSARVWSGKPDVYHAYQAVLLPELPTAPSFARALRDRGPLVRTVREED